jgi:hypothetical protein
MGDVKVGVVDVAEFQLSHMGFLDDNGYYKCDHKILF